MANEVIKSSSMLQVTNQFIEKLHKFSEATQLKFSDYEKTCVSNAIRVIDPMLKENNVTWNDLDVNSVVNALQQTAFLKLNPATTPRECYFKVHKNWDKKANRALPPTIAFGIEGMGNDTILMNNGRDVKYVKSYIVFEGDKFEAGETIGWETVLPRHKRMWKKPIKAIHAVYLIKKTNDETDVMISEREDVKVSLIAHVRNNLRSIDEKTTNEIIKELNKLTVDEILNSPKWMSYKIKKQFKNNTYESPLFSPAWTSEESQESMVQRKLRNHAVRRYPTNFNPEVQALYEQTFEDEHYIRENVIEAEETIENAQLEYEETSSKEHIEEPKAEKPKTEKPKAEKPKVKKEMLEVVEETDEIVEEPEEEEDIQRSLYGEEEQETPKEAPDWMF